VAVQAAAGADLSELVKDEFGALPECGLPWARHHIDLSSRQLLPIALQDLFAQHIPVVVCSSMKRGLVRTSATSRGRARSTANSPIG
jgi:hypothetical protein